MNQPPLKLPGDGLHRIVSQKAIPAQGILSLLGLFKFSQEGQRNETSLLVFFQTYIRRKIYDLEFLD